MKVKVYNTKCSLVAVKMNEPELFNLLKGHFLAYKNEGELDGSVRSCIVGRTTVKSIMGDVEALRYADKAAEWEPILQTLYKYTEKGFIYLSQVDQYIIDGLVPFCLEY